MANSSHWVIPKKDIVPWGNGSFTHTPAFKLFHYPFRFLISKLHLLDKDYLVKFGYVTTGDNKTDEVLASEEVVTNKTIAQMVDFHRQGVGFRLQNPKDGVKMYEIIHAHLSNWKSAMNNTFQTLDVPIDDLKAIDEFAKELYVVARGFVKPTTASIGLSAYFAQIAQSRGGTLLRGVSNRLKQEQEQIYNSQHQEQSSQLSSILKQRQHRFKNG